MASTRSGRLLTLGQIGRFIIAAAWKAGRAYTSARRAFEPPRGLVALFARAAAMAYAALGMAVHGFEEHSEADDGGGEDEGIDLEYVRDVAGFALRSRKRHPWLSASLFVAIVVATVAAAVLLPRSYSVDTKLLAQRNLVLPALGNPNRSVPRDADNPTKNVAETILQRDNLVSLVKEADLMDRWEEQRPLVLRWKDRVMTSIVGPMSDEDRMHALVAVLEKKLQVASDDTTVTISIAWTSPQIAYDIVSLVMKNFLDAKFDAEVAMITDAIGILEDHAKTERQDIDDALGEMQRVERTVEQSKPARPAAAWPPTRRHAAPAAASSAAASDDDAPLSPTAAIEKQLDEKRDEIKRVEDARRQTLDNLNAQLAEALKTLAPAHPKVIELQRRIEDASQPSPEIAKLRAEERALLTELANAPTASLAAKAAPAVASGAPALAPTARASKDDPAAEVAKLQEDPSWMLAKSKLVNATTKYEDLMGRIDSAHIELDVQRAAFKYRYIVVRPPELPKKPTKPKVPLIVVGGFLAALVLSLGAAAAKDLASGVLLEGWQVSRRLKVPVLGRVRTGEGGELPTILDVKS